MMDRSLHAENSDFLGVDEVVVDPQPSRRGNRQNFQVADKKVQIKKEQIDEDWGASETNQDKQESSERAEKKDDSGQWMVEESDKKQPTNGRQVRSRTDDVQQKMEQNVNSTENRLKQKQEGEKQQLLKSEEKDVNNDNDKTKLVAETPNENDTSNWLDDGDEKKQIAKPRKRNELQVDENKDQSSLNKVTEEAEVRPQRGNRGNQGTFRGEQQNNRFGDQQGGRQDRGGRGGGRGGFGGYGDNREGRSGGDYQSGRGRGFNNNFDSGNNFRKNGDQQQGQGFRGNRDRNIGGNFRGNKDGNQGGGYRGNRDANEGGNFRGNRDGNEGGNYRGNRDGGGGRGFPKRDYANQNRTDGNIQNQNQQQNHENKSKIEIQKSQTKSTKSLVKPRGQRSWPQMSIYIKQCKLAITYKQISQNVANLIIFPLINLNFDVYPGNLINKFEFNYRQKIENKIVAQPTFLQTDGEYYLQKCLGMDNFQYIAFFKISQNPNSNPELIKRMCSMINKAKEWSSILLPYSRKLGSLAQILNIASQSISKTEQITNFIISTNDTDIFKQSVTTYAEFIKLLLDKNMISIEM